MENNCKNDQNTRKIQQSLYILFKHNHRFSRPIYKDPTVGIDYHIVSNSYDTVTAGNSHVIAVSEEAQLADNTSVYDIADFKPTFINSINGKAGKWHPSQYAIVESIARGILCERQHRYHCNVCN